MVDQLDKFTDGPRCLAVGSLIDDHSSYSSDFESLSSISVSSTSSEFSEIEQVILEEVNDEIHSGTELPRPVVMEAWGPGCGRTPTIESSGASSDSPNGSCGVALAPVRRARVRGTVFLSGSITNQQTTQNVMHKHNSAVSFQPDSSIAADQMHTAVVPSRQGRSRFGNQYETLSQHAIASDEELLASLLSIMDRQHQESADQDTLLEALNKEHLELALMYELKEQELSRMHAQSKQKSAELSELHQARDAEVAQKYAEIYELCQSHDAELAQKDEEILELRQTQVTLQEELQMQRVQGTCVVCLGATPSLALVPCGHLVLCRSCRYTSALDDCPICRCPIDSMLQIFVP